MTKQKRNLSYYGVFIFGCFLLLLFYNNGYASRGIPVMKNYHHSEYRAESQNWAVVEDSRGFIYFANLSGVLEFDGTRWRLISLPGNLYATSLGIDQNGVIYVGSHSEFGYLKSDKNGVLHYQSLIDLFPESHREFSFIWRIKNTSEGVFFSNYDNLFRYANDTITIWEYGRFSSLFTIHDKILIYDTEPDRGLMMLKEDSLQHFSHDEKFADFNLAGIFPYDNNYLLAFSYLEGFIKIKRPGADPALAPFIKLPHQNVADYIRSDQLTHGIILNNGHYAFSTLGKGMILMDHTGQATNLLNESMGLQNETVNYLYEDSNQILWLALDNGITSVNNNLDVSYWNRKRGIRGSVIDIHEFNDFLYIATWQGLFRMNLLKTLDDHLLNPEIDYPSAFEKVEGINGISWKITSYKNKQGKDHRLLVATASGLHTIDPEGTLRTLSDGHFYNVLQSEQNPEIIIAAGGTGLKVWEVGPEELSVTEVLNLDDMKHYEVFDITEDKNLSFWLTHRNEGVSLLQLNEKLKQDAGEARFHHKIFHYNTEHGLHPKTHTISFKLDKKIYFLSEAGLQHYVKNGNSNSDLVFKNLSPMIDHLLRDYIQIRFVRADKLGNIWLQTYNKTTREKKVAKLVIDPDTKKYRLENSAFNFLSGVTINNFFQTDESEHVWLATDGAVYKHAADPDFKRGEFGCYFRFIRLNDKLIHGGSKHALHQSEPKADESHTDIVFAHNQNNLAFGFAVPNFFEPTHTLYSTFLDGNDSSWSLWSPVNERQYINLAPGHYTLKVRGKDVFGNIGNTLTFSFSIKKPWYNTYWAYSGYFAAFVLVSVFISTLVNKRLIRAKQVLENKIAERTVEITEKQEQIEVEKQKADELLKNILPVKIASELKTHGAVKVQFYDMVTIMFMDFKDFSKISQFINPMTLIYELNTSFSRFDEITQAHRLEKIKTIGDAYMCAGGIPDPNLTNPFDTILAAFNILNFFKEAEKDQWLCDIRIGIHTGEILAGVIGKKKFAYDIWGESVNTASRMEASGEPGRINISGETYNLIKDFFICEYRGVLTAKHQNEFEMYFVNRIRPKYSKDPEGTEPNDVFWKQVNRHLSSLSV